jgi:glycosyltransferase involved in cell wall biosynthesis
MRIAYLGQMADIATENGISKKIRGQATAWLEAGHAVRYFSLVPTPVAWPGLAPVEAELLARGSVLRRLTQSFRLAARVRAWRPDAIYFRYAYHSAGLPALFRAVPTVAEINSDDLTEYPVTLSPAKVLYHRLTRRRVLDAVSAFVPVTREIGARLASFGKPAEVIANGIDLADFEPAPLPARDRPPQLVFVGSGGTPWHGLERVAELARLFPASPFDIIGCTADDWRRSAAPGGTLPGNLRFHGVLARPAYEPLLRAATAALGTLALFRKQMDEACPLKVREYLALGLPVLAAYQDTDIPPGADYFFRLPNNSAPLDAHRDKIAAWLARWRSDRVPRTAIAQLDHAGKERRRLDFIAEIVARHRPA